MLGVEVCLRLPQTQNTSGLIWIQFALNSGHSIRARSRLRSVPMCQSCSLLHRLLLRARQKRCSFYLAREFIAALNGDGLQGSQ